MDEDAQAELAAYRHTIDNLDAAVIHMLAGISIEKQSFVFYSCFF